MQKIDSIELLLSQIGYVRKTDTIGYHITLSRSVSTFKHYLKPKDSMDRFITAFGEDADSSSSGENVLTAKRVYTSDAFLSHSIQYGENLAEVDMPYRIKDGITNFLSSDIAKYQSSVAKPELATKRSLLSRIILGKDYINSSSALDFRGHDLFQNEDGYLRLIEMYVNKCLDIVAGDAGAAKRFAILMEMSGFRNYEDLALIAKDTTDADLKMFMNFIQANVELEISITDFKNAYNVFTMVDKSNFID
jgi:hypothetical protein